MAALLALLLFLRRPRGKTPMDRAIAEVEDAMRRVGRPVTTGTTLGQLERRLGSHSPEVAAYLRALASGRYGLVWVPPPREGRRALRRALAQGLGFGGPLRAWWALPPRFERRPREPSRACSRSRPAFAASAANCGIEEVVDRDRSSAAVRANDQSRGEGVGNTVARTPLVPHPPRANAAPQSP